MFSLYNLGLTSGTIIAPPLSERFGRKPVFTTCIPIMLIFVMACGFSRSLGSLLVCRLFAGLFASPGITIASATMSDLFEPEDRGPALFCYYSMPWLGSLIGPLIGYLVLSVPHTWRWTQWVYLLIATPLILPGLLMLQETRQSKEQTLSSVPGQTLHRLTMSSVRMEAIQAAQRVPSFFIEHLLRPLRMLFTEPILGLVCAYLGFNFGVLYAAIVVIPEIFRVIYRWNDIQLGLSFLGLIIGGLLGWIVLLLDDKLVPNFMKRSTDSAEEQPSQPTCPEDRLHGAMLGALLLPIGLFWFAWTARSDIHHLSPIFVTVFISWGSLNVYASTSSYILEIYGSTYGASANGASSMMRYGATFVVPLFAFQLYGALGTGWATSLLGYIAVAMMPIPWCFYRWGPALRARCKFTTEVGN